MKNVIAISLFILLLAACKKSTTTVTAAPDVFIFGTYGGFCYQCDHYYLIKNNHVYQDSPAITRNFGVIPMGDTAYTISKPLLDSFPAYLLSHPNISLFCGGCADLPTYYIARITGNDTTTWNIHSEISSPAEVHDYMVRMQDVFSKLY